MSDTNGFCSDSGRGVGARKQGRGWVGARKQEMWVGGWVGGLGGALEKWWMGCTESLERICQHSGLSHSNCYQSIHVDVSCFRYIYIYIYIRMPDAITRIQEPVLGPPKFCIAKCASDHE